MNIWIIISIVTTSILSSSVNAALIERLNGLAYYDDNTDLTWLADANATVGSVYDFEDPGSGTVTWVDAKSWAASLNVGGVTGWRLPDTLQPDSTCDSQGYVSSEYNCTGSEMGNLFYNVLGGSAGQSLLTTHNANFDLFSNIQGWSYWSATELAPDPYYKYVFRMTNGYQGWGRPTYYHDVWAVYTGDVDTVPVPEAVWLFVSGLIGLIGITRKK